MYKVFFNNNILFLSNQSLKNIKIDICYNFTNKKDLKKFLFGYCINTENKVINIQYLDIDKLWKKFQKLFKVKVAGGGLVVNENNKLLFIKRRGLWDLPKGHQELNEEIEDTSIREVSEECGINGLKIIRQLVTTYHTYWIKEKIILKPTYWYEMSYDEKEIGTPQLEEDITEIAWLSKSDFHKINSNTFPSVIDVIHDYFESPNA